MIKLPALSEAERAWIERDVPFGLTENLAQNIAERIRLQLQAMLGIRIEGVTSQAFSPASEFRAAQPGTQAAQEIQATQPGIQIDTALAAIWLGLRYGGKPENLAAPHHAAWLFPLEQEVRRALAAAVINQNDNKDWPQAMQIRMQIGQAQGTIDISLNKETIWSWAWQHLRAMPSGRRKGAQGNE